jgi:hypothetical protein
MAASPNQHEFRPWKQHVVCFLVLAGVVGSLFWPVFLGLATLVPTDILHQLILPFGADVREVHVQNHYPIDVLRQAYPAYLFFQHCVREHECPLWNPFIMSGHPTYASGIHSFANPFNLLFWLLPMPAAFDLRIVLEFLAAAIFMYWLLCDWQLARAACVIGGLAYALNTQFTLNYWYGGFQTFVWIPPTVMFFERGLRTERLRNGINAGFFAGLAMLSGNIQSAAYVFLLLGFLALGAVIALAN